MSKATIEDFSEWIGSHLDKAVTEAALKVRAIEREHAAKGIFRSGGTVKRVFREVHEQFDSGTTAALGELARAKQVSGLDDSALRSAAEQRLSAFVEQIKATTKSDTLLKFSPDSPGFEKFIDDQLDEFDNKLAFSLRQFDAGFFVPSEPETPLTTTNEIKIDVMTGGAIQQGSHGSTQNVSIVIDIESTQAALAKFEGALAEVEIPDDKLADITADLDTIKAQLTKPTPSQIIVREAGQSLRNITEGIIASGAASQLVAMAPALWKVLGLG